MDPWLVSFKPCTSIAYHTIPKVAEEDINFDGKPDILKVSASIQSNTPVYGIKALFQFTYQFNVSSWGVGGNRRCPSDGSGRLSGWRTHPAGSLCWEPRLETLVGDLAGNCLPRLKHVTNPSAGLPADKHRSSDVHFCLPVCQLSHSGRRTLYRWRRGFKFVDNRYRVLNLEIWYG